jgi:hypothetical protein
VKKDFELTWEVFAGLAVATQATVSVKILFGDMLVRAIPKSLGWLEILSYSNLVKLSRLSKFKIFFLIFFIDNVWKRLPSSSLFATELLTATKNQNTQKIL